MAGTLVKKVMLQIVSSDGDTELKLDRISEKADELGRKHPELKVRIDTAAASAKIAVLRHELKDVARDAEEAGGSRGLLSRMLLGSGGGTGGLLGGAVSGLSGLGGIIPGLGAEGGAGGAPLAAVAGGGVIAALLTGIQGIVPMLASAGLGVGAFAAVAYPQFKTISGAITQISTDTQAYDRATSKAAKSSALKHIRQDWASMSGPQRAAVHGIQSLQSGFSRIASRLSPLVFKVFADGLKVANQLLPFLAPLATAAGKAIDGLLGSFSKFVASPGFKGFMANMTRLAGPSIRTFGEGIGKIVVALGKLIVSFENPDMQRAVGAVFTGIAGAITGVAWVFTHVTPVVVRFFAQIASVFRSGRRDADSFGRGVGRVFHDIGGWIRDGERDWDRLTGAIRGAAHRVAGDFDAVKRDAKLLWDAITKGGAPLRRVEADMRKFGESVRHAVGTAVRDLNHFGSEAAHWLGQVVTRAVSDVMGWFSRLGPRTSSAMGSMLSSVLSKGGQVLAWFQALPGRIGHWLAGLPGQMLRIGENVISGLISGIESGVGRLFSSVSHIAGIVTSTLSGVFQTHSPSRLTFWHGQMLAEGLALGIDSGHRRVQSAAARMAAAATGAPGGYGRGAAGRNEITVKLEWAGGHADSDFISWLGRNIRVRGGSPEILTQKVKLA